MTLRSVAWLGMSLLALAVTAYTVAVLFAPEFRPPIVEALLADRPISAISHFIGGAIALAAGALQVNRRLRTRYISVHRWLGRVYVVAVAIGGLAGLALSLHSFGGLAAKLGFAALAIGWLASTVKAYVCIKQNDVIAHRSWMIRSYSLTLAAVTLRIYMPLSQMWEISALIAYPAIAWLAWVPNLVIAEWFIRSGQASIQRLAATTPARASTA